MTAERDEREREEEDFKAGVDSGAGKGFAIAVVAVVVPTVLYTTAMLFSRSYDSTVFAVPFFTGLIAGLFDERRPYRTTLGALFVSLFVAVISLREGVVCVIMALPLITPLAMLGTLGGGLLRRAVKSRRKRRGLATMSVLFTILWQAIAGARDEPKRHPVHFAVAGIDVAASEAEVFSALTQRALPVKGSWPWFIAIGLPIPQRLEVIEPREGGRIRLVQSTGIGEGHIREWVPERRFAFSVDRYVSHDLPFHITRLGRSPNYGFRTERVEDWLTVRSVRYTIVPLWTGGVRLERAIEWQRHLAPGFYFGWLQQTVIERGQLRLLELLRDEVERTSKKLDRAQFVATR